MRAITAIGIIFFQKWLQLLSLYVSLSFPFLLFPFRSNSAHLRQAQPSKGSESRWKSKAIFSRKGDAELPFVK